MRPWQTTFEVLPAGSNVRVPSDFLGIHMHRYPTFTTPNPNWNDRVPPPFQFAAIRSHDADWGAWRKINTANGVYDWTRLDAAVALGVSVLWTMYGTPTWAARPADQSFNGPYGGAGESGVPADMATLATFTTALVSRYNTGGQRGIKWIEAWNEPRFPGNRTGFFWGTAVELVTMTRVIRDAAKAVDPDIKILSPGFVDTTGVTDTWLNAVDPSTGLKGAQLIDGFAYHPYTARYDAVTKEYFSALPWVGVLKPFLAAAGVPNMPVYATEWAFNSVVEQGLTLAPAWARKAWVKRNIAIQACLGIQATFPYSYNSGLMGDLINDTTGVIAALNECFALCGKTITSAIQTDGVLVVAFSDGTSLTV